MQHAKEVRLGALALSSKKTSSQLLSDTKASIEDVCIGRLLHLKAIVSFVSQMKQKYDVDGTLDWQAIVGHFADAKVAKKKLTKKNVAKLDAVPDPEHIDGKSARANASPAQKKPLKSKEKSVTPKVEKSPKEKSMPAKPPKTKKDAEEIENAEEPVATTMVDPFFITNDGTNYISTAVIDRTQPDGPSDDLNRRSRRANRLNNNSDGPKTHTKNAKFNKAPPKLQSFGGSSRNETRKDVPDNADADVHPSWSAKRKQKSIPAFQGKKIKFDGSEDKPTTANTKSTSETDESSKLHPSWVAKQKLKPVIAAFKGSKIIFD